LTNREPGIPTKVPGADEDLPDFTGRPQYLLEDGEPIDELV
jgi:hypothetical protein